MIGPATAAPAVGLQPGTGLGLVAVMPLAQMQEEERKKAEATQAKPLIQGLAGHVKACFTSAEQAKRTTIENRLLACVRARNGEYEPDKLQEIAKAGGSQIYMMLTSNKCRAAASWIKDVMLGSRKDPPWGVEPTEEPTLSPEMVQECIQQATQEAMQVEQQIGMGAVTPDRMREIVTRMRDRMLAAEQEKAGKIMERMRSRMEDQLQEGGFYKALDQFIDDLVTFPFAVMKGPIPRKMKTLKWVPVGGPPTPQAPQMLGAPPADQPPPQPPQGMPPQPTPVSTTPMPAAASPQQPTQFVLKVEDEITLNWERVDPFMLYWSPKATDVDDGYLIERHRMSRASLYALIGVEGYDEAAIRAVLDDHGRGGLRQWLSVDSDKASAEGKDHSSMESDPDPTIDALQFWGSVQGKMLVEWGMDKESVPDEQAEYACEVWTIGQWVIKATLNPDPLSRKPYYKTSYETVPGSWAGNGVADLVRDCQNMCNAAARSLANNMGISSGPMVYVNVDRMPTGEDVTQLYPWRIFQTTSDPTGGTARPVDFFQPGSNAQELMGIYERFSVLADEYSGVPRYMTGDSPAGGAGRTASGMSMLMNNAGKSIKQVIGNIDNDITVPLIDRLYFYNMKYADDPSLKGDVRVVAKGVSALVAQEAAQVRMNEILNIVSVNPMFTEIVGEEAIADLLREVTRPLNMDIVPPKEVIRARMLQRQQMMLMQQMMAMQAGAAMGGNGPQVMPGNKQQLKNGAPVTDNFAPQRRA